MAITLRFPIRDCVGLSLVVAAVTLACWPLIIHGPQTGDSLYLNLPWFNFFAEEVLSGTAYPRWLMDMSAGAGSPVFFFYGAIPFYFTTLAATIFYDAPAVVQLGIGQFLIVLSSACAFYIFIRHYADWKIAAFGAVLYAVAPYHFEMELLYRQAIGEAATYIWLPLIFLALNRLASHRGALPLLAASYALLVMTHLPTALLCSPFLLIYSLVIYAYERDVSVLLKFGASIVLGLSLSACYLLPAIFMQRYISSEYLWVPYFEPHRWFFLDGASAPNPQDEQHLFLIAVANSIFFLLAWPVLVRFAKSSQMSFAVTLLLLFVGSWFLMTPVSALVWKYMPLLHKVQFPWRILVLQEFAVVTAVVLALAPLTRARRTPALAFSLLVAASMLTWSAYRTYDGYRQHVSLAADDFNQASLRAQAVAGRGAREYIPTNVMVGRKGFLEKVSGLDRLTYDQRRGSVEVVSWRNRSILLSADVSSVTPVAVKQLLFPGWFVSVNGRDLEAVPTRRYGLIRFDVPAGQHEIELKLEPLWPERLGWMLTSFGFILSLWLIFRARLRQ